MDQENDYSGYLTGKMLVATPLIQEGCFEKSVIYVCAHNESGAMGLVLNHAITNLNCGEIFDHLGLDELAKSCDKPIYFGGPVETEKGFVLHTKDYSESFTQELPGAFSITSTIDILKDIARGAGPRKSLITLGCAAWSEGQLEEEIKENSWLITDVNEDIMFDHHAENKWERSTALAGVPDMSKYSHIAGSA